jgi:tetratricopeptide (TPR) repeat protein
VLLALSSPLEALEAFRQGLSRCDAATDRWEHSIALFNVGEACSLAGKYEEASEHLDQAYAEKTAIGDRWGLAYTHHARAQIHLDRGDLEAARAEARAGARVAKELGDPKLRAMLHVVASQVHLAEGRLDDAQRGFDLALEDAGACAARTDKVAALVGLTETERARGRAPEALAAAQRAMAAAAELGPAERASALVAAAGAAILQRDANGRLRASSATHAERSLGEAARLWEGIGQPYRLLDVIEARVRLETARGRDADAKRLARELIERAKTLGAGRHERAAAPLATAAPEPDQGA